MQTFLPYPSFTLSARCLDDKRLNKQIVEAYQIYQALTDPLMIAWKNHPATKMWKGYECALLLYGCACGVEWHKRKGTLHKSFKKMEVLLHGSSSKDVPPWLGDENFHKQHRAILLGKNTIWYSRFNWAEQPAQKTNNRWPYIWPI